METISRNFTTSTGRTNKTVTDLLRIIKSFQGDQEAYFGLPETLEGYEIVRLAPYGGKPIPIDWKARNEQQEAFDVESQRIANSLVEHMLYPNFRF